MNTMKHLITTQARAWSYNTKKNTARKRHDTAPHENTRGMEDMLRSALERMKDLYAIGQQICAARSYTDMLEAVVSSNFLRSTTQAYIVLFSDPWESSPPTMYEIVATYQRVQEKTRLAVNTPRPFIMYPFNNLLTEPTPVFVEHAEADPRLTDAQRQYCLRNRIHSMSLLPLVAGGNWYGELALYVDHVQALSDEDRRHIIGLAQQISIATDNLNMLASEADARREAERADLLKTKFLSMLSHELRTPLTTIRGFAATLLAEDVEWDANSYREFLAIIYEESAHLGQLIERLLDLSRLVAGTLDLNFEPESFAWVVHTAGLEQAAIDHHLVIEVPDTLPPVMIDSQRIVQVLVNLVTNAAQHSPPDSTININATTQGDELMVTVSDEGEGIPTKDRANVFAPFKQAEVDFQEQKGVGIGLAICKGIIEAHRGRIWVQEAAENRAKGTTIAFTLMLAEHEIESSSG
jgi:signal transduction histidine kinase